MAGQPEAVVPAVLRVIASFSHRGAEGNLPILLTNRLGVTKGIQGQRSAVLCGNDKGGGAGGDEF